MAQGGFKVTNNGKIQYCYKMAVDYDEMEFSLNDGKPQKMNRDDFSVEAERKPK
jgi:hypothetical protein